MAGLLTIAVGIVAVAVAYNPDDIVFPFFIFGVLPWVVGRTVRTQTELARELAEKEARVAHLRELDEASAVASERSRVARELHDVLAHNLSVMVIQASAARRALATDPQAAIDAAALIERTGREALVELRHVFGRGASRRGRGPRGLARPRPGRGAGRPRARRRAAGGAADRGRAGRASAPGAEMAAYRLIQEALTNALKHAGAASTARGRPLPARRRRGRGRRRRRARTEAAGRGRRRRARAGRDARADRPLRRRGRGRAARGRRLRRARPAAGASRTAVAA